MKLDRAKYYRSVSLIVLGLTLSLVVYGRQPAQFIPVAAAQDVDRLYERKTQEEINKLQEEIRQLKAHNKSTASFFGRAASFAGLIGELLGSVITLVVAFLGFTIPKRLNEARVENLRLEKELAREKHTLDLFRDLASLHPRQQLAAAAVLLQRLSLQPRGAGDPSDPDAIEHNTIVDVLVAVIKEKHGHGDDRVERTSKALAKYVADRIIKALGAVVQRSNAPAGKVSPLAAWDWQEVQLVDVWWKRVDARGIDFYRANFENAGLSEAFLEKATFYEACLRGAVLRDADLRGANLQGADLTGVNLVGADLTGAILTNAILDRVRFDARTKWPNGFEPPAMQATA